MNEDILPALSFSHDLQLISLMVDVLGQVPVASNTSDLWVVLVLLLQFLAVVDGLPLPWSQLRDRREVLCRLQLRKKKLMEGCYIERYQDKVWRSHDYIPYAYFQMFLLNF